MSRRNCKLTLKLETQDEGVIILGVNLPAESPEVQAVVRAAIQRAKPDNRQLPLPLGLPPDLAPRSEARAVVCARVGCENEIIGGLAGDLCPECMSRGSNGEHQPVKKPRARRAKPTGEPCQICAEFYQDGTTVCDKGRPACSPHRVPSEGKGGSDAI